MKLIGFFCFLCLSLNVVKAQYQLSGTGYSQHFDSLIMGLPQGWDIDTNASATSLGGTVSGLFVGTPSTTTRWSNASGGFKNVASANSFSTYASATSTAQLGASDRALAIRQTGSFGDPGAAFVFQIEHTFRLSDFEMDIKLQSLDSASGSRVSKWLIQYAVGDSPSVFTTVAIDSTGGNTFANKSKTVNFGAALDDKREPVWIRILSLHPSTGAGSRTTTAIDDMELRWTGYAEPGYWPLLRKVYPENAATSVPTGTVLKASFSRNITLGTGDIRVKNETTNTVQTIPLGSSFISVSGKDLLIAGVHLLPACTYHVTFDSAIVDTAFVGVYALVDTNEWRFSTVPDLPTSLAEYFDGSCALAKPVPYAWSIYNEEGEQYWSCYEHAPANASFRMYGNDGLVNWLNTDWLISPELDVSAPDLVGVSFSLFKTFSGDEMEVLLSDNYAGSGSPDSANWYSSGLSLSTGATDKWLRYTIDLSAHLYTKVHIAFKYHSTAAAAYDIRVDSVETLVSTGFSDPVLPGKKENLWVLGSGHPSGIALKINSLCTREAEVSIYTIDARLLSKETIFLNEGENFVHLGPLNLNPGLYLVSLSGINRTAPLVRRFIVE